MPFARLLREPATHFLAAGVALFLVHHLVAAPAPGRRIVVSAPFADALREEHRARTGRAPTADEERALVDRFVDEEVLVREALALGLDRGDLIVRRRLAQKMESLAADAPAEPTDAELLAHLEAHRAAHDRPRLTLRHVFLERAHAADAPRLLERLARGDDDARLGDPFLHGRVFVRRTTSDLESLFGAPFAAAVAGLEAGRWAKVPSSYGVHLVRVDERATSITRLDDVRARLREELLAARRQDLHRAALARLRASYTVALEPRR